MNHSIGDIREIQPPKNSLSNSINISYGSRIDG